MKYYMTMGRKVGICGTWWSWREQQLWFLSGRCQEVRKETSYEGLLMGWVLSVWWRCSKIRYWLWLNNFANILEGTKICTLLYEPYSLLTVRCYKTSVSTHNLERQKQRFDHCEEREVPAAPQDLLSHLVIT